MEKLIQTLVKDIGQVLLGKEEQVKMALTCLFARGHLLLEDLPGMGKTTLAHALANVMGLQYNRVQFTSDLLPADILGVSVFDRTSNAFNFHPGPVFTQVLLADEINRTTPKTQSALLEAMAEHQVTVDGETRDLPEPFFVIATQNPVSQSGTFPLPESQLDRFLMRIELGYPDADAELAMFKGQDPSRRLGEIKPRITLEQLAKIQASVEQVHASDSLLGYLQRLVQYTRTSSDFAYGISPRGALALLHCARTWALVHGRDHVLPEDLQQVMPAVVAHRLRDAADYGDQSGYALVEKVLNSVDVLAA
ncbi:MoxR family ATPase [Pseudomaricurvus alkylphenolicus]|jgi:MoxR-like ATPase|uniref:AAA family ATPase n=1 Tax=Pseudomaricurvus alkylphenolicus TaxID=1306991 RepID=UPI00141F5975|nr:MoxR family ATPase [Pseudomaricurvus alkylphenolicus]NIB41322.1 MoxR family ATPase [Pseudomaricurvus alkylphenolicus]